MVKKNKEMFKGGGGTNRITSAISDNHEIKIAILLWFFSPELYLRIISKKKISEENILAFSFWYDNIKRLYDLLYEKNITKKTSIKFSDLKNPYLRWIITKLLDHITADTFGQGYKYEQLQQDQQLYAANTLAQKFIDKCESLRFPTSNIDLNITSYHLYVYKFLRSNEPRDKNNRIKKEAVVEVIEALINAGNSEFDDYQLNYENQFTIDITRMCGSKMNLLTDIDIPVKQLQDELKGTKEQVEQLHDELVKTQTQVKQLQDEQQQKEEEEADLKKYQQRMKESSSNNSGNTAAPAVDEVYYGGNKSKKLPKKDILGKTKSIHKIPGDRKEYVKHKGKLITVKSYKELMKKKK